jgi:branched-subunit amino acid transport protein
MAEAVLFAVMAAITYASRVVFLARGGSAPQGRVAAFLERFPLALFVSLAAATLLVPDSGVEPVLGYAGFGGAAAGALATRRSLTGVLLVGGTAYWVARLLTG